MRRYTITYKDGRKIEFRAKGLVRWNLFKLRALRNPFFFEYNYISKRNYFVQINTKDIVYVEVG